MMRYKLYIPNLILIAICFVVLVTIYLLSAVSSNLSLKSKHSTYFLQHQDSMIRNLQGCKDDLYLAENAYQFYLVTRDTHYKYLFISNIGNFIDHLDSTKLLSDTTTDDITIYLQHKVRLAGRVVQLKEFADDILVSSLNDSLVDTRLAFPNHRKMNLQLPKYVIQKTDTVKYVPVKTKKTLVQKIASLFKHDKDSVKVTTSQGSHISRIDDAGSGKHPEVQYARNLNRKLTSHYKKIMRQELEVRKKIDEDSRLTALYNQKIFSDIQKEITEILTIVDNARKKNTYATISTFQTAQRDQNNIFLVSLVIIAVLVLLLGYKAITTRRYEKTILTDKEHAEELSKMKASFLDTMSHEIRTPLTAIVGFADYIHTNGINDNTPEFVKNIKYASDHLLETVNEVLEFSRLESGKVKIVKEPFCLTELLENVITTYQLQAQKKNITLLLKSTIDASLIVISDSFHLRQVLYNLVNNAIKFTEKGTVTLNAFLKEKKGDNTMISFVIEDTGIGIAKEAVDEIFKEFVQIKDIKEQREKNISGTGLGLSITKKLVLLLGGTIKLESELNKGSRFLVTIPVALSESDASVKHAAQAISDERRLKGKRILLAEDSEPIIYLAKTILNDMMLEVMVAKNGEEAWKLFMENEGRFDYVLTDIEMPGLNGNELAQRIRERNMNAGICIIAMTAHTSKEEYERYLQDGIDAIITKPFRRTELNKVLTEHL